MANKKRLKIDYFFMFEKAIAGVTLDIKATDNLMIAYILYSLFKNILGMFIFFIWNLPSYLSSGVGQICFILP